MLHSFSIDLFQQVILGFAGTQFIPHGHCYLWQQNIVWLHLLSDSSIAIAYYSIPLTLLYLVRKREDVPFDWIFLLFGGFIVSCGTIHLMEIWTLWHADYWASGVLKAVTAIISVLTAIVLVRIIPKVLAIPSIAQLKLANQTLKEEVIQRKQAEENYRQLAATLEQRVNDRTQELEQARLAAEQSEQKFRAILDNSPSVVFIKDLDGCYTLANAKFMDLFGRSPQDIPGLKDADFLPADIAERLRENDQQVIQQRSPIEFEESATIEGEFKTYLSIKFPLCNEQGAPYAVGGISIDITERKKALKQLAQRTTEFQQARLKAERSKQQLRAILDNTTSVIYVKDLEGRLTLINQHFATIFNRQQQDLVGLTDYDYLPVDMAEQVRANDQRVLEQRSPIEFEESVMIQNQLRTYISVKFPLCDSQGIPYAVGGISTDITDRKLAKQELEKRAAELGRLNAALQQTSAKLAFQNQELDQFSYIVSHDLKAPLRAISNLSEWIEDDIQEHLTEDTRHQMHLLRDRVQRMNDMVQGLLEYSRAGRLEGQRETVQVGQLLADIIDLLVPPPDFEVVVHEPMPVLKTEKQPLNQIFMNLISNAIKHHNRPDGRIEISAKPTENGYEFTVQDDGPGIEPQHQQRIFNIFETLSSNKKAENTGLGLALVKRIVNKQSGTIRLSSNLDQGAAFIFTWPVAI